MWNQKYRYHPEDLGFGGRIMLKWIFKKEAGRAWTGLIWLWKGQVAGCCVRGDEPSSSIKRGVFLQYLEELLAFQEGPRSVELECKVSVPTAISNGHLANIYEKCYRADQLAGCYNNSSLARFEVLTAMLMINVWDMTPCLLVSIS